MAARPPSFILPLKGEDTLDMARRVSRDAESLTARRGQHLAHRRRGNPEEAGERLAEFHDEEQGASDREGAEAQGDHRRGVDSDGGWLGSVSEGLSLLETALNFVTKL